VSERTGIAWTDHTFNPWWGCVRVSPGCENCYAERDSKRYGFKLWGPTSDRRFFGDKHWNEPRKWDREAERAGHPSRVFCASMADVFEDRRDLDESRARLFALVEETRNLRWQILTKRPENVERLVPTSWRQAWPDNAWALVTAEDQQRADERIPILLTIPARVRGVSYEPALGPVDFDGDAYDGPGWLRGYHAEPVHACGGDPEVCSRRCPEPEQTQNERVDWVIVGGESGPGSGDHRARPFDVAWAHSVVAQCRAADVPVFVKQLGDNAVDEEGPGGANDPECHPLGRVILRHRAGSDPDEWPQALRVREFPL
jgi:protein gp37